MRHKNDIPALAPFVKKPSRRLSPLLPLALSILSAALLAALSTCAPKPAPREYITIGALLPLTGEYCDEGVRALNGLLLAREEINASGGVLGKKIDLFVLDDEGDEKRIVEQYQVLKQKGVTAVVGSIFSNVTLALAKAAEKDGMPVISPTASNPEVTQGRKNVFRVIFTDDHQATAAASFAHGTLGAKTAVIMGGDDRYERLSAMFERKFKAGGGKITAHESFSDSADLDAVIKKHLTNQPDIIYCPTDYNRALKLIEAARRAGLDKTNFMGSDGWDGILSFLYEPEMESRIYFTVPFAFDDSAPEVAEFSQKYFDNFSFMPISTSALSYSAMQILADAIAKAGNTNAGDIINVIRASRFDIVTGPIRFDENNNPQKLHNAVYIMRIKNGYYSSAEKVRT